MNSIRAVLENVAGIGKDCKPRMTIDSARTSIAEIVEEMKKPVPEMITTDYLKKIGVEEAALVLHRRSKILGWNDAISNIAKMIGGQE